jgi:hypothetical protein
MSQKRELGPCVFCGHTANTTDHIPPRGLFAKPRPANLIKVPACKKCNNGSSKDDEYARQLALEWGAERSHDGREVNAAVMRSFEKPEAQGLRKGFYKSLEPVQIFSPSGALYLGSSLAISLDGSRLGKIVRKIIKGLYWHAIGKRRLSEGYEVFIYNYGQPPPDSAPNPVLVDNELRIQALPETVFGDRAFAFRCGICPADQNLSVWWVQFYGTRAFMGYTMKLTPGTDTLELVRITDTLQAA